MLSKLVLITIEKFCKKGIDSTCLVQIEKKGSNSTRIYN
jgi:hypothetical protein